MADKEINDSKENGNKSEGSFGGMLWIILLISFTFIFASSNGKDGLQTRNELNNNPVKNTFVTVTCMAEDRENLRMLILCEAADLSTQCKIAIAATVINRVEENFGSTITEVITAPNQFGCYYAGQFYIGGTPVTIDNFSSTQIKQVDAAIDAALSGSDPTSLLGGALYYYNYNALSEEERHARSREWNSLKFDQYVFYR